MKLIVKHAFEAYQRGDAITDQAQIDAALKSNPRFVLRVAGDEPTSAPVTTTAKASAAKSS